MSTLYAPSLSGWIAFSVCFLGWAIFEMLVNLRLWRAGSTNRDRLSRYIIIAGMILGLTLAVTATQWQAFEVKLLRPQVFYLGVWLMLAGLIFRWYAIRQLGQFFIPEVAIQPGQRVIDKGLYRFIRHPSYTGTFITIIGYGLALTNWLSLIVILIFSGAVYGYRIYLEEAALLEAFGEEYRAYMRRTKRLLPFIL